MTQKKKNDEISLLENEMNELMAEISAWKPKSYDPAGDPLFAGYSERFQNEGQRAMRDTVGRMSALTGGYGNSYAQTAGQAAYDDSLSRLSDILPTLASRAEEKNKESLAALYDRYELLKEKREDALSEQRYNEESAYKKEQDALKNEQWEKEFEKKNQEISLPDTTLASQDFSTFTEKDFERYFMATALLSGKENAARLVQEMAKVNLIPKGSLSYYLSVVESTF